MVFVFYFVIEQKGWLNLTIQNFICSVLGGSLSGIIRAPLTAIFLIAESTGGYILMVPLMIVSAISFFISRYLERFSIYTKELAEQREPIGEGGDDRSILSMMKLR